MDLAEETVDDVHIIKVREDRIDAAAALDFKSQVISMASASSGRIVIDMKEVDFVDSSGLGAIVATMKELEGRSLELAGMCPTVAQVFRLTRMDTVFKIHDSIGDAVPSSQTAA